MTNYFEVFMEENIIDLAYERGRKDGILDMLKTIEIVAGVVSEFPEEDQLNMFLRIIKEI